MITAELATCRVLEDPASTAPVGGICHDVHGILRARIQCAITPIYLPSAIVLWPGVASLDTLRDLAYGGLHDLV
jgi:hypothetical protein